ncbi:SixA phosphatase family protein [Gelidibacter mesophilus]|uniref:SixA phosphatase family protein n=1 Tax=Gelidibacter mesophilus TaxID=169050 RepID=UPI000427C532|nr:phosphoglycerate mutase family protein [Gelidibacter mesophilus]
MIRYLAMICFVLLSVNSFAQKNHSSEITTYYFIRHAEKDRSDPSEKDAHLTGDGYKRARHWSEILQHIPFDAVYSTDYNRTKETGQPTAAKNQLDMITYSVSNGYDDAFKTATRGKTVLIVGHSNTIPDFVNAVIGTKKYVDIDDANNGNLYIVTISNDKTTDLVLTIN